MLPVTEYMALSYQSKIFRILPVKSMTEKFQNYQQCVYVEVDLTYSTVCVAKKKDLCND